MAKSGVNYNLLLIVGGVGVAMYFLKDIFKSSAEKAEEKTDRVEIRQDARTDRVEIRNETIRELFNKNDTVYIPETRNLISENPIGTTDAKTGKTNTVSKITLGVDTAFGLPTQNITSTAGNKSTIIAAPNTYYKDMGVGFDSKGSGYSSAFVGNASPKIETAKAPVLNVVSNTNKLLNKLTGAFK